MLTLGTAKPARAPRTKQAEARYLYVITEYGGILYVWANSATEARAIAHLRATGKG